MRILRIMKYLNGMSKYTKEEQEFLDKAAIAAMQAMIQRENPSSGWSEDKSIQAYYIAETMLTERKKLFGDE